MHKDKNKQTKNLGLSGGWHTGIYSSGRLKNSVWELYVSFNSEFFQDLGFSCKLDFEILPLVITIKDIWNHYCVVLRIWGGGGGTKLTYSWLKVVKYAILIKYWNTLVVLKVGSLLCTVYCWIAEKNTVEFKGKLRKHPGWYR